MADVLKGIKLHRNNHGKEEEVEEDVLKDQKIVGIYFSAHWCPPCKQFTPLLKDFYNEVNHSTKQFEIVFVSLDRSPGECQEYMEESHGNWLFVYPTEPKVEELCNTFNVEGIPALVIVNHDGSERVDGRNDVNSIPPRVAFSKWADALKV